MTQPRVIGGRYELGELIGYGGMAEVHRGRDVRLGRDVAIKILRADLARDPAFLHRFRREAQSAAGLNHPSIVAVYDTGEDLAPDGTAVPYIVMEFVEGRTLRDILKAQGRLPVRRAMEIVADVCGALDFSHRNGIVHRDIKPANVMITEAGAVKVMDFGIARAVADSAATVTQTANVIGTAQYLSPEQARGESVDARSDVYSTGCLLYELITGAPPFQGDSPVAVAYQHVRENATAPSTRNPEVPPAVDSIVMKALAKNPMNRYQSAAEMRTDLQRALANQPVAAEAVMSDAERTQFIARTPPPPIPVRRMDEPPDEDEPRRGMVWLAIVLALLLVIGAAIAAIVLIGRSDNKVQNVTIPLSVVGETPSAAENTLRALGFVPVQSDSPTSDTCDDGSQGIDGRVCKTNPKAGTAAAKGSTVTYSIFKPASVQVPYLVGLSYNDAVNKLHTLGLQAKQVIVDTNQPAGLVVAQDKQQFTEVAPGSTITLSVSSGKVKLLDVRGKKLPDALSALNGAGWTSIDASTAVPTADRTKDGTVATESPSPGIAYPLSTQVTLTVYKFVAPTPTCTTPPPSSSSSATATPTGTGSSSPAGVLPPCPSSSSS
ncbi:MAG TPA: Stk1 family PASTA domain-containing Ser/Thr kinase [Jatrophihabitantaceae bacterium]|nr:Stk1 family PASTA domain-containing Ser/Thr kinase [Jatrophihabitantaceae bacterium]